MLIYKKQQSISNGFCLVCLLLLLLFDATISLSLSSTSTKKKKIKRKAVQPLSANPKLSPSPSPAPSSAPSYQSLTSSDSSLVSLLQECYTPHEVLANVGRYINPQIDPLGTLSSLVLVRLAKQCMTIDNTCYRHGIRLVEKVDKEVNDEKNLMLFSEIQLQIIQKNIVKTLAKAPWDTKNKSSMEAAVEGTKSACILARIIHQRYMDLTKNPDQIIRLPLPFYLPLLQAWKKFDTSCYESHSLLEPHHLSGLQWSYDMFRLVHYDNDDDKSNSLLLQLPPRLQQQYSALNLPFRIRPGHVSNNVPNLNVQELKQQVYFAVDEIKATASNQIIQERRQTAWQGDNDDNNNTTTTTTTTNNPVGPFYYSGKSMPKQSWSPLVRSIRDILYDTTNEYYNCCLLNLYPNGKSGMRYHIDPDQGTLWGFETAVVSVGPTRKFVFRDFNKQHYFSFYVFNGDVAEMFGNCQFEYQHAVKMADDKNEQSPRGSLVFKKSISCATPTQYKDIE